MIYYISKIGNDSNPGTQLLPWLTITKATKTLLPGDIVYILRGTYNEQVNINTSGTLGNSITYSALPGDERLVIIDGTGKNFVNQTIEQGIVMINASFIIFSGIRVQNSTLVGIRITGNNVTLYNNQTYNTACSGIAVRGSYSLPYSFSNILIDNNDINLAQNGQYGENMSIDGVNGVEVRYNIVHDGGNGRTVGGSITGGEGIDIINCANVLVHHNIIYNTYKVAIYLDGSSGLNQNINVYDNLIHNVRIYSSIEVSAENSGGGTNRVNIYNNIVYNPASYCIALANYFTNILTNVNIINNTFIGPVGVNAGINLSNIIFRNNIATHIDDSQGITKDHNWFTDTQGAPGFINPTVNDYHLMSTSRLIDAGSSTAAPITDFDSNSRPQGKGFDIGAYEYTGGKMSTTTPFSIVVNTPTVSQTVVVTLTSIVTITVTDQNRNPLNGATVTIGTISTVTNISGIATLTGVPISPTAQAGTVVY